MMTGNQEAALFFVAGELSGDARGAELMRALREAGCAREFHGAGGPQMERWCAKGFLEWTGEAVVGLWDVLKKYGYFRQQMAAMIARIEALQPAAVVLIDYPGFNSRLAQALRKRGSRVKIVQYVSPQVWAWNRGRVQRMAGYLDLMLCLFPFEPEIYEASGLHAIFVGHPLVETARRKGERPREEKLVGLFPGSRPKEVQRILPPMLAAAELMVREEPALRFEVAAAAEKLGGVIEAMVARHPTVPAQVRMGDSAGLMQRAGVGMVASGTATLEAAFYEMPLVILYLVAWPTWEIGKRLVKVKFLGMVNLLAGREVAREFLQEQARPAAIAAEMLRLVRDETARAEMQRDLRAVVATLGGPGAAQRAAAGVLELLAR